MQKKTRPSRLPLCLPRRRVVLVILGTGCVQVTNPTIPWIKLVCGILVTSTRHHRRLFGAFLFSFPRAFARGLVVQIVPRTGFVKVPGPTVVRMRHRLRHALRHGLRHGLRHRLCQIAAAAFRCHICHLRRSSVQRVQATRSQLDGNFSSVDLRLGYCGGFPQSPFAKTLNALAHSPAEI